MSIRRASIVAGLCFAVSQVAGQPGGATLELRPGEWRTESQIWLDGQEVLGALESASQQATDAVLANLRAQMSPEERAEFDRNMADVEAGDLWSDVECITPEQAEMPADQALEQLVSSIHEPPWMCAFSNERADAQGYSLEYRCTTARGALAEGRARFESGDTSYRMSLDGRAHVVDMDTGEPLSSQIVDARSITTGEWVSEECSVVDGFEE